MVGDVFEGTWSALSISEEKRTVRILGSVGDGSLMSGEVAIGTRVEAVADTFRVAVDVAEGRDCKAEEACEASEL